MKHKILSFVFLTSSIALNAVERLQVSVAMDTSADRMEREWNNDRYTLRFKVTPCDECACVCVDICSKRDDHEMVTVDEVKIGWGESKMLSITENDEVTMEVMVCTQKDPANTICVEECQPATPDNC